MRESKYDINSDILNRWSPRAFSGEKIADEDLMAMFEAGRWAPSSYNSQPWRFIYAKRETPEWDDIFNLLADPNQVWCKNASALVVIISRKNMEYKEKPDRTHAFTTGAAFQNICLEGMNRGVATHGMAGFDFDAAYEVLDIPEPFEVQAMLAIGKQADKSVLPEDLQKAEVLTDRKPLEELVMHGKFSA
jgi:nitroreductase